MPDFGMLSCCRLNGTCAAINLKFYISSQFPAAYKSSASVTVYGSWNCSKPSGYKVVRIKFNTKGQPVGFEDFITGFVTADNKEQFGRICGLAIYTGGSLLISDDDNGVIYRVTYGK